MAHTYSGFVSIKVNPEKKEIWLERSGKATPDAYSGTVETKWSHKNVAEIVKAMDDAAKKGLMQLGKANKAGTARHSGVYAPEGREGCEPVLMRYSTGPGVYVQFMKPRAAPESKQKKSAIFEL